MGRHLTQDELIQYKFELAETALAQEMRVHLEECAECRERLAKLAGKFTSLDDLKEEVGVSDELEARTVAAATRNMSNLKSRTSKRQGDFPMPVWMQGVAAVIVAGLLTYGAYVMISGSQKQVASSQEEGKSEIRISKSETIEEKCKISNLKREEGGKGVFAVSGLTAEKDTMEDADEPPFAPASAIELNVLPRRENVQLTIYNSADLTLVRENRKLTLKKGWNWLQLAWANTLIDPTSLSLEPKGQSDKIDVQQLVYPARVAQTGRWLIRSQVEGEVPFEVTYFTSGVSWRAFYMGTLTADESEMRLEGFVRVDNGSGEEYADAQTRLIVGQVHQLDEIAMLARRQYPYDRPVVWVGDKDADAWKWGEEAPMQDVKLQLYFYAGSAVMNGPAKPREIVKEGLSEYFLYTIEGTETIPDGWGKRLPSFAADGVKVKSLYKYDEERWGAQTMRYVSFVNDEEHKLGQTPLPDGMVRIFSQSDDGKGLAYVGGAGVKYIPVNEEVELELGAAQEVAVEPKLMGYATENHEYGNRGDIRGWDEIRQWQIEIRNSRAIPAEVEIMRGFGTNYWKMEAGDEYEKYDASHAKFKVRLDAREKKTITYTVRTYHGTREQKAMSPDSRDETL